MGVSLIERARAGTGDRHHYECGYQHLHTLRAAACCLYLISRAADHAEDEDDCHVVASWLDIDWDDDPTEGLEEVKTILCQLDAGQIDATMRLNYWNITDFTGQSVHPEPFYGLFWFINHSDCDGIHTAGQVFDISNTFKHLRDYIDNLRESSEKLGNALEEIARFYLWCAGRKSHVLFY